MSNRLRIRQLALPYRLASARSRRLPDFLILGAQRSGTSSLHAYLAQHPEIISGLGKEIHFFDGGLNPDVDNYELGLDWYRAHFPRARERTRTFEASPLYLFNPLAPSRIRALLPNVRMIVLLRNPVERAISHYYFQKSKGREPLDMREAFSEEESRLRRSWLQRDYKHKEFVIHSYKARGLYVQQLERYFACFDRQQLLVISSERLLADPARQLRRIYEFIEVDPSFTNSDLSPRNVGRNRAQIDGEIRHELEQYFYEPNQALYDLLQEDLGWENEDSLPPVSRTWH